MCALRRRSQKSLSSSAKNPSTPARISSRSGKSTRLTTLPALKKRSENNPASSCPRAGPCYLGSIKAGRVRAYRPTPGDHQTFEPVPLPASPCEYREALAELKIRKGLQHRVLDLIKNRSRSESPARLLRWRLIQTTISFWNALMPPVPTT